MIVRAGVTGERSLMRAVRFCALWSAVIVCTAAVLGVCADVRIGNASGRVIVAPEFYRETRDGPVPLEFPAYPGERGIKSTDWFDTRIAAQPGDVIYLAGEVFDMALWVFTPNVVVTTAPGAGMRATIQGTLEIDADSVTVKGVNVVGPHAHRYHSGGHGIEINRMFVDTVRIEDCRIERNDWMGIHVIGARGEIEEIRVVDCIVADNGSFGVEAQSVRRLIIESCTITGNREGVHAGSYVSELILIDNDITGNLEHNVWKKE